MFRTIEDYYKYIDSQEIQAINLPVILENVSEQVLDFDVLTKHQVEIEIDCLYFRVYNGKIEPAYENSSNGKTVIYPNIDIINDSDINYLKARINMSNNIYLKARFAHIIWHKTNEFEYAKHTIDFYFDLIKHVQTLDIQKPDEHFGIEICYALHNLQHIVFSVKYRIDDLENLILEIINNPNEKSSCFLKLRLDCIELLIEKSKGKRNKFNKSVLNGIEKVCDDTLNREELSDIFIIEYMKLGRKISKIINTDVNKWILRQAEYYEKLSETSAPIIAPDYCQKAIDFYKELKDKNKINELYKRYSFLSKNVQTHIISTGPEDISAILKEYEKMAEDLSEEDILRFLIYSSGMVPNYQHERELAESIASESSIMFLISSNVIDEYGHTVNHLIEDEDKLKHQIYQQYGIWFDLKVKGLIYYFKRAIELNKITPQKVIDFLSNTWYGYSLEKILADKRIYKYSWLDYIQEPIKTFITKFEKCINEECDNFGLYIQEIDSLTLKIEGIIRDLIMLFQIDGLDAFCFDQNNNFKWKNINNYLYDEKINLIIQENDLWFIRYFLIDCHNLRNRTAHSLMFIGEYGIYNMIMLFVVILRLSKYSIKK